MTQPSFHPSPVNPKQETVERSEVPRDREPRGFIPLYALASFGIFVALMAPVMFSLAFKLQHITGSMAAATGALGLVTGSGAFVSLLIHPIVGRLSDRTRSRFGRRRPWVLGGVMAGASSLQLQRF